MRIIVLSLSQSILLVACQVMLKLALARMLPFAWSQAFWRSVLLNWRFALCGILFALASALWMYIIKQYPFSVAYPMISLSYFIGLLAAVFVFHEDVAWTRWVGVALIVLGCCVQGLSAAPVAKDDTKVIEEINRAASRITSMTCDFVQTRHIAMLNDKVQSEGRMSYRTPERLTWEYTTPYRYTFSVKGEKVEIKKGERTDVIDTQQNKMFQEIVRIMMDSMLGKCISTDSRNFTTRIQSTAAEYVATLAPKRGTMKQMFKIIVLHFDRRKGVVRQVELVEHNGDRTVIEMKNIQTNVK